MSFAYRELRSGEFIKRCSAILANSCQCPRAGQFVVVLEDGQEAEQQICLRCKVLQEANFAGAPILYTSVTPKEASSGEATQEKEVVNNDTTTTEQSSSETASNK